MGLRGLSGYWGCAALAAPTSEAGLSPWRGRDGASQPSCSRHRAQLATLCLPAGVSACSARTCLFVARHPSQGARGAGRTLRCRERLPGSSALAASARAPPALASPGAPAPPPSPASWPPWWRGHLVLRSQALGFAGVGSARWRGSTHGGPPPWQVSGPLAGQPPQRLQAAGGGHVPHLTLNPDGAHPAHRGAPRAPASCSLALSVCPESILSHQLDGRMPPAAQGPSPAPLLTLGPCGLAPPWGLPLAETLEAPRPPRGRHWTQQGSWDTPLPPPQVTLPSPRDRVDSAEGCPRVLGSEAGALCLTGSRSASCQVLGSVSRSCPLYAAPPFL